MTGFLGSGTTTLVNYILQGEHGKKIAGIEYEFGEVTLTTFYCLLVAGTPALTEHVAIKWLLPSELDTIPWAPADIPAVELIRAGFI